jgi:hypothetical protein
VLLVVEVLGHAAFAMHAALERHTHQVAFERVAPLVVRAGEFLDLALVLPADGAAAVCAAVFHHVDAVGIAHDDDLLVADPGSLEAADIGQLAFKANVVPGVAGEEYGQLFAEDLGIAVNPQRNTGVAFLGPAAMDARCCDRDASGLRGGAGSIGFGESGCGDHAK